MSRPRRPAARLALLAFLATAPFAARGEAADDAPTIRAITPNAAARGTSVEIAIEGKNLFPLIEVKSSVAGVIPQVLDGSTAFKLKVRLTLSENVPAGPIALAVKTRNGTVQTERFTVRLRAPIVSKVVPAQVKRGGDYEVTITGQHFSLPGLEAKVTVPAPMAVARLPKGDEKTLVVKLTVPPTAPAGPHAITVEMPDGKANAAFTVLLAPPAVKAVKPASVARGGEHDVTIEGVDLAGAATVVLAIPDASVGIRANGAPESKSVPIHVTVRPDAKPGPRTLVLLSPDGVTTATLGIDLRPPALGAAAPIGAARGTAADVKVAATDLPAGTPLLVVPPDPAVRVEAAKSGAWKVTSEATARPGPRTLAVSTEDGAAVSLLHVTLRPPTIASIGPAEVAAGKESEVRVEGEHLAGCAWSVAPEDADVEVRPAKAAGRLVIAVKAGAKTGPRTLVARSDDGAAVGTVSIQGSSATSPLVSSITPPRIDRPAEAAIALAGMNLRGKDDAPPEVTVVGPGGATLPVSIGKSTPSALSLVVKPDAKAPVGTYLVTVRTDAGGTAVPLLVTAVPPSIASVAPARLVRPAAAQVTVTGSGLSNPDGSAPTVTVAKADGSMPIPVKKVTAAKDSLTLDLDLAADAAPGGYVVAVQTTDGGAAVPLQVEGSPPTLATIAPARMGVPSTQDFTVTGENLRNPDGKPPTLQVTRTGSASELAPLLVSSDAKALTFRVSTRLGTAPGPQVVSVRTADGVAALLFTVVDAPPPVVTGIDLAAGARGGTFLTTVRGSGLTGATEVVFEGKGVAAVVLSGGNERELPVRVTVAADAEPGPRAFSVTAPGGAGRSGTVTFAVK
jgi:hypothetical protein